MCTSRCLHFELIDFFCLPEDGGPGVQGLRSTFSSAHYEVNGVRLIEVELTALLLTSEENVRYPH